MNEAVRQAAEDFGCLVSVAGARAYPPEGETTNVRYDEYLFRFERGALVVTAEPSDDTIRLSTAGATLPNVVELTGEEPWDRLIGCGVIWIWLLTNHRGHADGFQVEFGRPGSCWSRQLMCEGAALSARSLATLDRMSNLVV